MYGSRSVWAEHEAQSYREVWQCYDHSEAVFRSPEVLADHLHTQHSESLTESQISDLVDAAETSPIDERVVCPICLGEGPFTKGLQNHLANHLERIALFALPRGSGDAEDGSNASSNAPRGVGAVSQASWWSRSLTFSDYGSAEDEDKESRHFRDAYREIDSLFKSAETCRGQDKLDEAKKKYQQALEKFEETFGLEQHPMTFDTVMKLADVYTVQREFDVVEKMYLQALE
jgi:tetratricopeptide (TPR) repeat protein